MWSRLLSSLGSRKKGEGDGWREGQEEGRGQKGDYLKISKCDRLIGRGRTSVNE